MKKKSKIMAHIRRTRHIMMPSHRDYFDYSFLYPIDISSVTRALGCLSAKGSSYTCFPHVEVLRHIHGFFTPFGVM